MKIGIVDFNALGSEKLHIDADGQSRIIIENVQPQLNEGRYPIKRVIGEEVVVTADIFTGSYHQIHSELLYRTRHEKTWCVTKMMNMGNDTWKASFVVSEKVFYVFTIQAWINDESKESNLNEQRLSTIRYNKELSVNVEFPKALFSTWHELFPRSASHEGKHGTLQNVIELIPRISSMGFDVLYLPPIHPIGKVNRKGKNNNNVSEVGDPGSPWAIGSEEGGHKDIHPQLGTIIDYKELVSIAKSLGIDVALDLAYQCSPDHPYVREHPEWFKRRKDNSIEYAQNPPKKYQDIYPFDFECTEWKTLWRELFSIVLFWINIGVKIFRVDNPHTKPIIFLGMDYYRNTQASSRYYISIGGFHAS